MAATRPIGSRTFGGADLTSARLAHLISRLRVNNPSRKATVGSVAPSHLAPCLTGGRREGWHESVSPPSMATAAFHHVALAAIFLDDLADAVATLAGAPGAFDARP